MMMPSRTMGPVALPSLMSPYGTLTGQLFLYGQGRAAFESPVTAVTEQLKQLCPNKCILLGGLSDGLLPVPYTAALEQACQEVNWSLVQPVLSSSYTGFGHGRLDRDTAEIQELLMYLRSFRQAERFALVGHSTGCQNICHYLQTASQTNFPGSEELLSRIQLVVLQAPVSDREHAQRDLGLDQWNENIATAERMVQAGQADEMMPRRVFWAPITAQRFLDLHQRGGLDDYFSSDYSDLELKERLGHIGGIPTLQSCLIAFSGSDEYVPTTINSRELVDRLVNAVNSGRTHPSNFDAAAAPPTARGLHLASANHNLSKGEVNLFIHHTKELLQASNAAVGPRDSHLCDSA